MKVLQRGSFALLWVTIIAISVHDGLLVLANRNVIAKVERNPIGTYLLGLNSGDIWILLAVKTMGTVAAAALLLVLYQKRPKLAWLACAATAAFQLGLLVFLYSA